MLCYLTTGKHAAFYVSFGTVLILLAITAPAALGGSGRDGNTWTPAAR